jgi:hypothetical protein
MYIVSIELLLCLITVFSAPVLGALKKNEDYKQNLRHTLSVVGQKLLTHAGCSSIHDCPVLTPICSSDGLCVAAPPPAANHIDGDDEV